MMIQNNKTDNSNDNKPAAVSNNTSPSKQAGSKGEIKKIPYIQYKVQHRERKVLK